MRKRHFTDFVENVIEIAFIREFGNTVAVFKDFLYLGFEYTIAENKFCPLSGLFTGSCHDLPCVSVMLIEQEKFNNCTRLLLNAVKTCRENPRIIEYKAVALMKKIDYIIKMKMLDLTRFLIEMHKP